jgi:hypothetical protein
MLYMARFGHRRGRGEFVKTFGKQRDGATTAPTIATVADGLRSRPESSPDYYPYLCKSRASRAVSD